MSSSTDGRAYYNEIDRYCCDWLQNLMDAGHIMPGKIDDRSIEDVQPEDLEGYDRCHFFAGIAGWELALRLAGWTGQAWTGSCPCQPLSSAGQRKGHDDERHLWPAFHRLIAERKPATVFGEQVASKDGREWFSAVRADLERLGYACGGADMPAAGVGAPHIRQRLWWVADATDAIGRSGAGRKDGETLRNDCKSRRLADTDGGNACAEGLQRGGEHGQRAEDAGVGGVGHPEISGDGAYDRKPGSGVECERSTGGSGILGGVGDANQPGSQGRGEHAGEYADQLSPWAASELIPCADGKARPVEPGIFPLADGIPARLGQLRAYGNAIIPQVAAEFVAAFMESRP